MTEQIPIVPEEARQKLLSAVDKLKNAEAAADPKTARSLPENGKDIDLDFWMVDEGLQHLYSRAKLVGGQYVVEMTEWKSVVRNYSGDPAAIEKETGWPRNLGAYITMEENGPEGWHLFNVLPNGSGLGAAIFRRILRTPLPDPVAVHPQDASAPQEQTLDELKEATEKWARERHAPEVDATPTI
jgi:hypothetical protein